MYLQRQYSTCNNRGRIDIMKWSGRDMNVKEAIRDRRSIGKVKQDSVDKSLIEEILEAGVWAPNHCHTEPWRSGS